MRLREAGRWAWRQLTSMRVALVLLFLLAVAAIPGSVFPQRSANPLVVADWVERNPGLAPWAERLQLFDVYSSPWFSAIYLLLLVSLVGCILPRLRVHVRALRAEPPRAPRRLDRLPSAASRSSDDDVPVVLDRAAAALRNRRFRVRVDAGEQAVSAEKGYAKETGNLLFHVSVVVVLLAVALGGLYGYRGAVLVVSGDGFASSPIQYDSLSTGPRFDLDDLPPFALTVDDFLVDFVDDGPNAGSAADFEARVTLVREPGAPAERRTIRVNEPLSVDGSLVHLLNPGYAPEITIRSADGTVIFSDAVPFLPQDDAFTSTGVVKAQVPPDLGEDIGLQGIFLPTAAIGEDGPVSLFPEPRNAGLVINAWVGDLGLDDGVTQSVYRLDTEDMNQLESAPGEPFRSALAVGESVELPGGNGTVTFDGYRTWVNLQVSRNAGKELALLGTVLAILGLLLTFFVRRRRIFVRVRPGTEGGRPVTVVHAGGLDRAGGDGSASDLDALLAEVAEVAAGNVPGSGQAAGAAAAGRDHSDREPQSPGQRSHQPEAHGVRG